MSVLAAYRHHRNWSEEDVASHLGISTEEYKELEIGLDAPDGELAIKLSELYLAPPHLFITKGSVPIHSTIFSNCSFSGNGAAGYINHLHNDQKDHAAIIMLKEEIRELQKMNEELLKMIVQRQ